MLKNSFNEVNAASGCFVKGYVCLLKKLKIKTYPYLLAVLTSGYSFCMLLDVCFLNFAKGLLIFNFVRSVAVSDCIYSVKSFLSR